MFLWYIAFYDFPFSAKYLSVSDFESLFFNEKYLIVSLKISPYGEDSAFSGH